MAWDDLAGLRSSRRKKFNQQPTKRGGGGGGGVFERACYIQYRTPNTKQADKKARLDIQKNIRNSGSLIS